MDRYNNIFLVSTSEFVESWGASMSWKRVLRIKSHRSDQQWIDIFNKERTILFYACWYIITAHKLNSCVNLESSFFLPFLQLFVQQVDQVAAEQSRKKKKRTGGLKLSDLKTLQQTLFDNKIIHVYFIPVQFM